MDSFGGLFNLEAEQSILGSVLVDNTLLSEIRTFPEHFYRPSHRVIFWAMAELYCEGKSVDLITLVEKLKSAGKLDDIGGLEYLMFLHNNTITTAGCQDHAEIIKELYQKRELLRATEEIKFTIQNKGDDSTKLINSLQKRLDELSNDNSSRDDIVDITQCLGSAVADLERMAENKESGLKTHFLDLDNSIGGLFPSDLVILAARPGMGKTALALNIARNIVYREPKSVLVVSLEMSREQLQYRLLSSLTGVELSKFRTPSSITPEEWNALRRANSWKSKGHLDVCSGMQMTIEDIMHRARKCQHDHGLDLVIVDYLQLIVDRDGSGDRVREVSKISRGLKAMAMELDIPVIALSQLNRGLEARNNKRPILADLRESGSIEQDADMVMFVYRDNYYNPDSEVKHSELIIAKNRHGARATIPLYFQARTATFGDLSRR